MPYTDAGKNTMLDALAPDKVSLHTAEPDSEGSNEVAGGEYERKTIEWNAAAAGAKDDKSNGIVFKIPASTTIKYAGYWKAGVFVAFGAVTNESFTGAGTYTLTDADLDLAKT